MKPLQSWFATTIYHRALSPRSGVTLNRELLKECRQLRDFDAAGRRWSVANYPGGYTSYGTMDRLQRFSSTFAELERHLNRHVTTFARSLEWDLGGRELRMTDCWVNIMPRGVSHGLHLHPNAAVSGTYYVVTPRGCPGLKFEDPRLDRFMAAPPRRAGVSPGHQVHVTYPATTGHLTLFESWLRHEVTANPVAAERISISFNYDW
ncbi:MAG: hypothetical protein KF791_20530 [Verrucomicrobiae bacterium]|nr:hypothetical protein [Verrucomicrobiae bacterium]